jgi:hypothetical protein
MLDKMYSSKQLQAMYDLSEGKVKQWFKDGLPKTYLGRLVRVTEKDLEEFIKSGKA